MKRLGLSRREFLRNAAAATLLGGCTGNLMAGGGRSGADRGVPGDAIQGPEPRRSGDATAGPEAMTGKLDLASQTDAATISGADKATASADAAPPPCTGILPNGTWADGSSTTSVNLGLAASYPNDQGLAANAHVFFAEDLDGSAAVFNDYLASDFQLVTGGPPLSPPKCMQHTWHQYDAGTSLSIPLDASKMTGQNPTLYARAYYRWDQTMEPVGTQKGYVGMKCLGFVYGSYAANQVPDGTDFYSVSFQCFADKLFSDGGGNVRFQPYSYNGYSSQAVNLFPGGSNGAAAYGNYVSAGAVRFNEWHCLEIGLRLNTPGIHDGEMKFWLDGKLICHLGSLRFRDLPGMLVEITRIGTWRSDSAQMAPATMWFNVDNYVCATRYIGPLCAG